MRSKEVAKAKEIRSNIIDCLYKCYGDEMTVSTLRNLLRYKGYSSETDIKRAIEYLSGVGKEYIGLGKNEENYWDSFIALTPKGVNLAEGDENDKGVYTIEESD